MAHCRDAGLPCTQHCRDTGHCQHTAPPHPSLPALQEQQQPSLRGHRTLQECRTAAHPALQEYEALQGCCPPGTAGLQGTAGPRRAATPPALQGRGALLWQGQSSTALATLPAQWHCQPRTASYRGTTHPPLQGCRGPEHHPSCTARGALPPPEPLAVRGTQGPCPGCAAVQEPPRQPPAVPSPGALQRQHSIPLAAQSLGNPTPCASSSCSLAHCRHTVPSHSLPLQSGTRHALGAHPVPVPTPLLQQQCWERCPPALQRHPCTAAPLPLPLAPHSCAHALPRPCQAHHQHHRLSPPVPSLVPCHQAPSDAVFGHQLSCSLVSENMFSSSRVQEHPHSYC